MKRKLQRQLIELAQRQLAQLDYARGFPPRKKSRTHEEAYGHAYATGEGVAHYEWVNI